MQEKAAHLLYFIVKNHPFADGNKRSQNLKHMKKLFKKLFGDTSAQPTTKKRGFDKFMQELKTEENIDALDLLERFNEASEVEQEKMLERDPKAKKSHELSEAAEVIRHQDIDQAIELIKENIKLDPVLYHNYLTLATYYWEANRQEGAMNICVFVLKQQKQLDKERNAIVGNPFFYEDLSDFYFKANQPQLHLYYACLSFHGRLVSVAKAEFGYYMNVYNRWVEKGNEKLSTSFRRYKKAKLGKKFMKALAQYITPLSKKLFNLNHIVQKIAQEYARTTNKSKRRTTNKYISTSV